MCAVTVAPSGRRVGPPGVPFSATISSHRDGRSCFASEAISCASESGRACVAMMIDSFTCHHFTESHDNILVHQAVGADHQTKQATIDIPLRRIFDAAHVKKMRKRGDRKIHRDGEHARLELAPAASERIEIKAASMRHPVKIVETHYVPVAAILDAVVIGQGSAPPLVEST